MKCQTFTNIHGEIIINREQWTFNYTAEQILEAVTEKLDLHNQQLQFWQDKREEILVTIRSEGIQISEKIALRQVLSKARDFDQGGEVMIRNDLKKELAEVYDKLKYHTKRRDTYDGWSQLLAAHKDACLPLNIADWLFFFGRDTQTRGDFDIDY